MTKHKAWLCIATFAWMACSDTTSTNTGGMITTGTPGAGGAAPSVPSLTTAAAGSGGASAPAVKPQTAVAGAGSSATPTVSGGTSAPVATAAGTSAALGGAAAPVVGAAGAGGQTPIATAAGASGGTVVPGAGGAGSAPPGMFASDPIIPEVTGDCPMFRSGSATVLGLSGINFNVGAKKEGEPTGPLVFYWHGTGSSSVEASMFSGSSEVTAQGGMVVAFGGSKGSGGDCSGTGTFALDDFKVVDQIVGCAVKNHNINPKRIYTTGCSAGGLMSGCMAIQRSNYLAATAPNSGGITIGYGKFQDPTRIAAVMTMHGSSADNVIVAFAETSEAYDNYMQEKGAFVINCDHGGGHCGAPAALQQSAWQFMKDHPFGTHPSPYAGGLPSGFHKACKIWTKTARRPLGEGRMMTMP